jgi:hypothetical protein
MNNVFFFSFVSLIFLLFSDSNLLSVHSDSVIKDWSILNGKELYDSSILVFTYSLVKIGREYLSGNWLGSFAPIDIIISRLKSTKYGKVQNSLE